MRLKVGAYFSEHDERRVMPKRGQEKLGGISIVILYNFFWRKSFNSTIAKFIVIE